MCAPAILQSVRHELSRRRFLSAAGACMAASAAPAPAVAQQSPLRMPKGFREVVDLTHPFSPRLPVYPGYKPVQIRPRFSIARDGFAANEVMFDEHTGTHLDAPCHFAPNGPSADRIPASRLVAPLAVISIAERAARNPDTLVTADDITGWEKRHGRVPAGAVVVMHSGWDARVGSVERFLNLDAKGTIHAPGYSDEAARLLVEQRDVAGIGVDTLSLDAGVAQKFVAHLTILGAGKYGLELVANLGRVPPSGATVVVGGPMHEGATGGPVRILALV